MTWLFGLIQALLSALFGAGTRALDDARNDAAHHDLGAAQQKQADTEAALDAKKQADKVALQPPDTAKTRKDLRDGTF